MAAIHYSFKDICNKKYKFALPDFTLGTITNASPLFPDLSDSISAWHRLPLRFACQLLPHSDPSSHLLFSVSIQIQSVKPKCQPSLCLHKCCLTRCSSTYVLFFHTIFGLTKYYSLKIALEICKPFSFPSYD